MDEARIRRAIYGIARECGLEKTFCPTDVARKLSPLKWRAMMPQVIGAAKRMAGDGEILMVQQGEVVDPSRAKGAFRLKMAPE